MIEDSEDDAFILNREFTRAGYEAYCERVDTAAAMADALEKGSWDVVICDFNLPRFSGLAALAMVKERGLSVPFLMVTGSVSEETAIAAMQAGANDYIMKDNPRRLVSAVERELRRSPNTSPVVEGRPVPDPQESPKFQCDLPVLVIDAEERVLSMTATAERLFGLGPQPESDLTLGTLIPTMADGSPRAPVSEMALLANGEPLVLRGMGSKGPLYLEARITRQDRFGLRRYSMELADVTVAHEAHLLAERRAKALAAFAGAAERLTYDLDEGGIAAEATAACVESFGASGACLLIAEPDGALGALGAINCACGSSGALRWDRPSSRESAAAQCIRSGSPVVAELSSGAAQGAFPLISRERPFGALLVQAPSRAFFEVETVQLIQAFGHQTAAALDNARLRAETEKRLSRLAALRAVEMAISSSMDLSLTFNIVLDTVLLHLQCDAAVLWLINKHTQRLERADDRGFRTDAVRQSEFSVGQGFAGRAALERRTVVVPDFDENMGMFRGNPLMEAEGFEHYTAIPVVGKGRVIGVLGVFHRHRFQAMPDWLDFGAAMATQIAIAIDSYHMFTELQRSNSQLTIAYDATIEGWARALELRDGETEGHSRRVTQLTLRLAKAMGLPEEDMVHIRRGCLLHDIGKMGLPDSVLLKPGPLNEEERQIVERHPDYAHDMLAPIAFLRQAMEIPYCHHERWDGTGYPRRLKGGQIPLAARIFAIVDVYDALRSDRPYREAWTEERTLEHLQSLSGAHFDPQVVTAFLAMDRQYYPGVD